MAITDIDEQGLASAEDKVCKMYSIRGKTFQLTAMHVNDGLSEYYLDTQETLEWVLDAAWEWYNTPGRPRLQINEL